MDVEFQSIENKNINKDIDNNYYNNNNNNSHNINNSNNKKKVQKKNNKKNNDNSNNNNNNINNINNLDNNNFKRNHRNKSKNFYYNLNQDHTYKLISPYNKHLEFNICPKLEELNTEFYHLLVNANQPPSQLQSQPQPPSQPPLYQSPTKCQKLKEELDQLKLMDRKKIPIPNNFNFTCQHQHSTKELLEFQLNTRKSIETIVRRFCAFLDKEQNMILMEMVILSIGLIKSIEFLQYTLEIESSGGILIEVEIDDDQQQQQQQQQNNVNNNSNITNNTTTTNINTTTNTIKKTIQRRRSPGGVFFKLINLHIPIELKSSLFSTTALFKYKRQKKKDGFGQLPDLKNSLLSYGSQNNNNNSLLKDLDEEFDKLVLTDQNSSLISTSSTSISSSDSNIDNINNNNSIDCSFSESCSEDENGIDDK